MQTHTSLAKLLSTEVFNESFNNSVLQSISFLLLTRGILTSFRFGGLPGREGGDFEIVNPLPIFYLWTDFDDFFF